MMTNTLQEASLPPTPNHITISIRFNMYRFVIHVSPASQVLNIVQKLRVLFPQHLPPDGVIQLVQEETGLELRDDLDIEDYGVQDGEEFLLVYTPTMRKRKDAAPKQYLMNVVNVSRG